MLNKSLILGLTLSSSMILAQELKTFQIQPMVVTATKFEIPLDKTIEPVTVITSKDIEDYGLQTIKDALDLVPNISNSESSGITSVFMQGMGSNHTKIMIDGITLKDPSSPQGTSYMDMIDLSNVDRIEIMSGAQSTMHGSEAIAGVINIITKHDVDQNGSLHVKSGSNFLASGFDFQVKTNQTIVQTGVQQKYDSRLSSLPGGNELDDYISGGYWLKITQGIHRAKVILDLKHYDYFKDLDKNSTGGDDLNYVARAKQNLSQISANYPVTSQYKTNMAFRHSYIHRETQDDADILTAFPGKWIADGETQELEWNHNYQFNSHSGITLGLNSKEEHAFDRKLRSNGLFGSIFWLTPRFSTRLGGRTERYDSKYVQTISSTTEYKVPVLDLGVGFQYHTGYRQPTLYEKYDTFSGNIALKAENSESKQLSFKKQLGTITTGIAFNENQVKNPINYSFTTFKYVQDSHRTSKSTEYFALKTSPGIHRYSKISYTTNASQTGSVQSLRIPLQTWKLINQWQIKKAMFSLTGVHTGNRLDTGNVFLAPYTVWNGSIVFTMKPKQRVGLKLYNLFNEQYQHLHTFDTLDRSFTVFWKQEF